MNELKGTISILIGLQNIIYATAITASCMIVHYLKTKCPGAQTLLDLIAMDTCISQMAFLTSWVCIINLGHFNGQANYLPGCRNVAGNWCDHPGMDGCKLSIIHNDQCNLDFQA